MVRIRMFGFGLGFDFALRLGLSWVRVRVRVWVKTLSRSRLWFGARVFSSLPTLRGANLTSKEDGKGAEEKRLWRGEDEDFERPNVQLFCLLLQFFHSIISIEFTRKQLLLISFSHCVSQCQAHLKIGCTLHD